MDLTSDTMAGKSIFHKIYFGIMILITLFISIRDKNMIFNNFFIAIFSIYFLLNYINPVMAFRFSEYIIIYWCLYPYKLFKYDKVLTIFSVFLISYFFLTFFDTHPQLK